MSTTAVSLSVFLASATPLPDSITQGHHDAPAHSYLRAQETANWATRTARNELNQICALGDNWDGFGALPIHPDTAENARQTLYAFQHQGLTPELTPNPNGTISFEWETDRGEAHIEVGRTRLVGMLRLTGHQDIPITGQLNQSTAFLDALAQIIHTSLFTTPTQQITDNQFTADVRFAT